MKESDFINNKELYLPCLTDQMYLSDKNIDYRLYLYLLELSNFNTDSKCIDYRYLYYNKLKMYQSEILKELNISYQAFRKKLNNLIDSEILEYEETKENKVIIKIRVKTDSKNFVLLSDEERKKLKKLKSNQIKAYLVLKYTNEKTDKIQLIYLSNAINLSIKNTSTVKKILDILERSDLIEYRTEKNIVERLDKNNRMSVMSINEYYYSIKN